MPENLPALANEALRSVERAWNAAAQHWDADQLAAIYTPDAVFFGGRPGISVGLTEIRAYFASYIGILKSTSMALVDQHFRQLGPETFLAQGYVEFKFLLDSGKNSATKMRTTLTIVKRNNQWKLIQHHFSTTPETIPVPQ
ncbi:MAG: SgcJ/EcaC family oxidoreductase [Betaproteobacteria bacterium]|nr:SgcJ/EcaC family oxidoreductase [Betaproteobacteria bacterium]